VLHRLGNRCLVSPDEVEPSHPQLQVSGVFNPGAIRFGDEVILLVRVAEAVRETRRGFHSSPRLTFGASEPTYSIDWFKTSARPQDQRKFVLPNGLVRLSSISHLEIVRLAADGYTVKSIEKHPDLFGTNSMEEYGIEDARITQIGDRFYITYVAVSSIMGIATGLLSTQDFRTFVRHGIIFPWENKDVVLFSHKIRHHYWAYHRPVGNVTMRPFSIMAAQSPDLLHWGGHRNVLDGTVGPTWNSSRIGSGPPPLKTKYGWLLLYHEVHKTKDELIGRYITKAALIDLHDPTHVLRQSPHTLLEPHTHFEAYGFVPNVIFPTGLIRSLDTPDHLIVYYGAADTSTAVVTLSEHEIIRGLA
jgi:beta-1,2-mannobiose phosphorylase / 1,2-beta-oligomannan phosphorylase